MQESYITHIRITEDGQYQSSPPPPEASRDAKKPRIIIISVRKSGRVRMHKARENVNGSVSIGKTWPLDDLSAIESFAGAVPRNQQEEQAKRWAGDRGFIVTIGKQYYWEANTSQERLFFIASLVKIFTKYTGGRQIRLIGFDEKEMARITTPRSAQIQHQMNEQQSRGPPRPGQPAQSIGSSSNYSMGSLASSSTNGRPMPPGGLRQPSAREMPPRPSTGTSAQPGPGPSPGPRQPRPQVSVPSFGSGRPPPTSTASPLTWNDPNREPLPTNGAQRPPTSSSDRRAPFESRNQSQAPYGSRQDEPLVPPPRSRGGPINASQVPGGFPAEGRTPTSESKRMPDAGTPVDDTPSLPVAPPERRRPPLNITSDRPRTGDSSKEPMVPAPLATPNRSEFMRPPARSIDRPEPPQPLRVKPSLTSANSDRPGSAREDSPTVMTPAERKPAMVPVTAPAEAKPGPPKEEEKPAEPEPPKEEERPGLGLMIKKKSKADVANAFRKMANAASAQQPGFKPRAGGAAERLRELALQAKAAEGPDGITSVVPAPSLLRRATEETSRPSTADPAAKKSLDLAPPEVKITSVSEQNLATPAKMQPEVTFKVKVPEKKPKEAKERKVLSEETKKQIASLGIDPMIVGDERTAEFASLLDEFGWTGEGVHTKNIDEMNDEINRELNMAQIGGWFDKLDEEDERVEQIKKDIDAVIAECDELDGLLTLYSVELGVRLSLLFSITSHLLILCRLSATTSPTSKHNRKASKSKPPTRNSCKPKPRSSSRSAKRTRSGRRWSANVNGNVRFNARPRGRGRGSAKRRARGVSIARSALRLEVRMRGPAWIARRGRGWMRRRRRGRRRWVRGRV